jgi:hypothetical protein
MKPNSKRQTLHTYTSTLTKDARDGEPHFCRLQIKAKAEQLTIERFSLLAGLFKKVYILITYIKFSKQFNYLWSMSNRDVSKPIHVVQIAHTHRFCCMMGIVGYVFAIPLYRHADEDMTAVTVHKRC